MKTFTVTGVEEVFNHKQSLQLNLDVLKGRLDALFSIVQNEGITISDSDLKQFGDDVVTFFDDLNEFSELADNRLLEVAKVLVKNRPTNE